MPLSPEVGGADVAALYKQTGRFVFTVGHTI